MPIYEFACAECGNRFEALVFSADKVKDLTCAKCGSASIEKQMSTFAPSVGSSGSAVPSCEFTGGCRTPNMPGCASGMCGM